MTDEAGKKSNRLMVPVALGVVTVVFAAVAFAWVGSDSGGARNQSLSTVSTSSTLVQTGPSLEEKQAVVAQMQVIQADLVSAWQACQANPSCVAQVKAIPEYQQLYDAKSAWFTGSASDDFASWRIDT